MIPSFGESLAKHASLSSQVVSANDPGSPVQCGGGVSQIAALARFCRV